MQMLPGLKRCIWRWDLRISVVGSMDWQRSYAFSFKLDPYDKNTLFFSVEEDVTGSKHCSGKVMVFSLCTRDSIMVHSGGPVRQMRQWRSQTTSTVCWCRDWRSLHAIRSLSWKRHPALCSLCKMPKIKKYQNCKNDVYQPDEKGYPQTVFSHSICYRVNRKTVVDNTSEKL